jgi:arylsulfatase A-like enzyme
VGPKRVIQSLGLAIVIACAMRFAPALAQDKQPNIVFILADNLGYGEIGAYGGALTRGARDAKHRLAGQQGFKLLNMNMETQCTPSRSSIMTGRFSIRSGTYAVPFGGVPEGLTQWEVTIAKSLSEAGYATALYGKWHLGSHDGRLPNDQGFDEWYGIPRTTDESMWSSSPGYSPDIVPPEKIMEGRRGEKSHELMDCRFR